MVKDHGHTCSRALTWGGRGYMGHTTSVAAVRDPPPCSQGEQSLSIARALRVKDPQGMEGHTQCSSTLTH